MNDAQKRSGFLRRHPEPRLSGNGCRSPKRFPRGFTLWLWYAERLVWRLARRLLVCCWTLEGAGVDKSMVANSWAAALLFSCRRETHTTGQLAPMTLLLSFDTDF